MGVKFIMKVDIRKVYSENEERAEIHAVTLTEEIQNAVDILENNKRSIPVILSLIHI